MITIIIFIVTGIILMLIYQAWSLMKRPEKEEFTVKKLLGLIISAGLGWISIILLIWQKRK